MVTTLRPDQNRPETEQCGADSNFLDPKKLLSPRLLEALAHTSASVESVDWHTEVSRWVQGNVEEALRVARASVLEFLQLNWTGPCPSPSVGASRNTAALRYLGETDPAYALCHGPEHLISALVTLDELGKMRHDLETSLLCLKAWWMRQALLEERSGVLLQKAQDILDDYASHDGIADGEKEKLVELFLIGAHMMAFYYDYSRSQKLFERAQKIANAPTVLMGMLGKRTRFQEIEYAQMVVDVVGSGDASGQTEPQSPYSGLPQNVPLEDDTLLDQTKLSGDVTRPELSSSQSATILSEGILLHQRHAKQNLQEEEIDAFINLVLRSRPPYAVQACALYYRSKLEVVKSRKTMRAMQQLESLLTAFKTDVPAAEEREKFALAANLPPFWRIEEELGFALLRNGCTKEAINIFTSLELWEDVIECYQRIGQKVKAEDLILKELAKSETPSMWCRLGDLRDDVECYEKAWEVSKHRSFRSRKDLARLYVKRQQYQDAVRVLRQGMDVTAVDPGAWFTLGYSLVKVGELASAEVAFRRCVNLDADNSLAWNNLGSIALKNQDFQRAYKILQDAVKYDFENWNIWDNYQNACQHVKDFEEELKACHRLLELRGKLNVESLALLVAAVMDDVLDIRGTPASRLYPRVKELFGALTAKLADSSRIWYLYGKLQSIELAGKSGAESQELIEAMVQKYQRAYRYAIKEKDWEKEEHTLLDVLVVAKELGKMQMELQSFVENEEEKRSLRSSLRVMLDNVIAKIRKGCEDAVTGELKLNQNATVLFDELVRMRGSLST